MPQPDHDIAITAPTPARILVVEDEVIVARSLQRLLRAMNYTVLAAASSGQEALRYIEDLQPDLVLLDVKLKGQLDGIQVAEQIQARFSTPVIYLTGYADAETTQRAKLTAPHGYLVKPIEASDLQRNVEMALHRHALERQLQASEERFRSVVEQSQDAMMLIDEDGLVVTWNRAAEKILGIPAEEALGQPCWEVQYRILVAEHRTPERLAQLRAAAERLIETRHNPTLNQARVVEIQRPDGERRFVSSLLFTIQSPHAFWIGNTIRDVTEQRRAELAQARLAAIVADSDDAILSKTLDGTIVTWNRGAERMYGYTEAEAVGQPVTMLVPPGHADEIPALLARLRRGERIRHFETVRVTQDGERLNVSLTLSPLLDAEGNVVGASAIARDISERKRAEAALRQSEREKSLVLDTMTELVAYYDTDLRIQWANRAAAASVGLEPEGLIGQHCYAMWHQRESACPGCPVLAAQRSGERQEAEITTPDGRVWFLRGTPVFDEAGQVVALVEFGQDITERVQAREVLQRSREDLEARVEARTAELTEANRRLRRYAEEQAALYAIASATASYLEPAALLEAALDAILPALDAQAGWAVLPDAATTERVQIAAHRGLPEAFVATPASDPLRLCPTCKHLLASTELGQDRARRGLITDCPRLPTEALAEIGLRQHVGIPLQAGTRLLGVLDVAWAEPRPSLDGDRDFLIAIGQQVGLALRNAQLYQAASQLDRLETVNTIGAAVISSLELDVVLRQILELTCHALDATEGSVLLLDAQTGELVFAQTLLARYAALLGQRLAPGQGIAGWMVEHRRSVRINDVHEDMRWYDGLDAKIGFDTHSLLGTPLLYRDEVIGVIEIVNKQEGEFTPEDLRLLEAVAVIAAVALQNARLFTATRARAEEMTALNQIALMLTASLDPEQVVQNALSQVERLIPGSCAALIQVDPATGEPHLTHAWFEGEAVDVPELPAIQGELISWALEQQEALLVPDVHEDPRWPDWADAPAEQYFEQPVRGLMVSPLLVQSQAVGALAVASLAGAHTDDDLRVVQNLSTTLAVALENARLYDALRTALHEREQTQEQLIQAEKMSALGRLAASIAHEINNPLQGVLGCLLLSQEELSGRARQEKLARHLEVAVSEVRRVSEIVRRMHDFYRHARTELTPTDVHAVVESVLTLSAKQLEHRRVQVVEAYAEALPAIEANPDHLKQVFLNLVLNAMDAMPEGGTLTIETAPVVEDSQRWVHITFRDTGVGIATEAQEQLFEPFFTTKEHGSGLGLSISYGIVEAHNGHIEVHSREGEGTSFVVQLPAGE